VPGYESGQITALHLKSGRRPSDGAGMPTDHDMPAAWQAQAARNHAPQVASAIAERARQQGSGTAYAPVDHAAAEGPGVLDELARRRVARFAALEARRLSTDPPQGPPLPPAAC
jgi:hypothetical protein